MKEITCMGLPKKDGFYYCDSPGLMTAIYEDDGVKRMDSLPVLRLYAFLRDRK